jgi:hypothetical protein
MHSDRVAGPLPRCFCGERSNTPILVIVSSSVASTSLSNESCQPRMNRSTSALRPLWAWRSARAALTSAYQYVRPPGSEPTPKRASHPHVSSSRPGGSSRPGDSGERRELPAHPALRRGWSGGVVSEAGWRRSTLTSCVDLSTMDAAPDVGRQPSGDTNADFDPCHQTLPSTNPAPSCSTATADRTAGCSAHLSGDLDLCAGGIGQNQYAPYLGRPPRADDRLAFPRPRG